MQPVVTPFELEIALSLVEPWNGRYILDFDAVLQEAGAFESTEQRSSDEEDAPSFSLVSGAYRQKKTYGGTSTEHPVEKASEAMGPVIIRNQQNAVSSVINSASGELCTHLFSVWKLTTLPRRVYAATNVEGSRDANRRGRALTLGTGSHRNRKRIP